MFALIGFILVVILIIKVCCSVLSWIGGALGNIFKLFAIFFWVAFKIGVIIAIPLIIIGLLFG